MKSIDPRADRGVDPEGGPSEMLASGAAIFDDFIMFDNPRNEKLMYPDDECHSEVASQLWTSSER